MRPPSIWYRITFALHLGPTQLYVAMFAGGVPVGLLSGYLLFLTVERRFMPGMKSSRGSRS